jgi:hypothetical protein
MPIKFETKSMSRIRPFSLCILACFTLLLMQACAQTKSTVQGQAFYKISMPGTLMADENGQPIQRGPLVNRFLILETVSSRMPEIEQVIYNGVSCTAAVYPVTLLPENIGKEKVSGKPVTISPAKGKSVWRIEVADPENKPGFWKQAIDKIMVRGKQDGRIFNLRLQKEKEIEALPAY